MTATRIHYVFSLMLLAGSETVDAAERYNSLFLHGTGQQALSTLIASDNDVLPGNYDVVIQINGQPIDTKTVNFTENKKDGLLQPCLSTQEYVAYGIEIAPGTEKCLPLPEIVPQSRYEVDIPGHRLNIIVPQQYLASHPFDYIAPTRFDDGINAAFINYNLASDVVRSDHADGQYHFLSLNNGINLCAWRFRNNAYWNKSPYQGTHWKSIASWVETNIVSWRSRLALGQTATDNSLFDSIQFQGIQLGSDNTMLPGSLSGYAPVIRGIANSNARVEVRQGKFLIYEQNVPAGPFEIKDLNTVNRSGDFYVTVIEADGSRNTFTVAWTSIPQLVRAGQWNYQVALGKYHDGVEGYAPDFLQGTLSWGLNNTFTLYGGVLSAENYTAAASGVGINIGQWGAVSTDYTFASTVLAEGDHTQGGSLRFRYAKYFLTSKTEFQLAGYRYSTSGYYNLTDAVAERRRWRNGSYINYHWDSDDNLDSWTQPDTWYSSTFYTKKNQIDASVRQTLGENSSLFLSFSQQQYWNGGDSDLSVQMGFNSAINNISYGVYYQNSRNRYTSHDDSLNFRISIPFNLANHNSVNTSMMLGHSKTSGTTAQAGVNGTLLDDGRMSYALTGGWDDNSRATTNASLGYQGQYGNVYTGYAWNQDNKQVSLNLMGGLVAHEGGVTLSQPLGPTFSLVEAHDASGVGILNQTGVRVDDRGYAVIPQTIPWRVNTVALNTQDIGQDLDIPNTIAETVPTNGAISLVKFETYKGRSLLIHSYMYGKQVPPVGAMLQTADGRKSGLVGAAGEIFLTGATSGDVVSVVWGDAPNEQCQITMPELSEASSENLAYLELTLPCAVKGLK